MKKLLSCLIAAFISISFQSVAQTILFEDFTSVTTPALPSGWTNTFTAVPGTTPQGWVTITEAADYWFNYSTPPHSQYAECTEYYNTGNDPASLTSPLFSLAGATTPYLSFDYLFNGSHYYTGGVGYFEEMYIQLSTDGGTTWTNIDTLPVGGYWDTRFIDLSAYAGSPNCKINFYYTDNGGTLFGALLSNVRVFNLLANDIALTSITPSPGAPNFTTTTTGGSFGGVMTNVGATTITSFDATYQVGAGSPVTCTFSGLSIAPAESYTFTCTTPFIPSVLDSMPVTMWVTETSDPILSNDTLTTGITGVTHFPVKKPVAEEATATWCDACPEGIVAMDDEESAVHEAMSFVAVHCSISTPDPMTDYNYGPWIQGQIPSYPYLLFDRRYAEDPTNLPFLFDEHYTDFGYADISMSVTVSGDTAVTVPVLVTPATNLSGVYKLALVLTEDSVHSNSTPSDWDQENFYSGGANGPMADAEYDFDALSNPVPATTMYYDHVDRSIYPSVYGGDYLPTTMTGGTPYTYTFTAPLATGWAIAHMHAIVLLIDSTTGYILNSDNTWLIPHTFPLPVPGFAAGHLVIYPNPATTSLTISADEKITTITISNLLGQTIYTNDYNSKEVRVNTSGMPSGMYLIKINGSEVRKFEKQ